MYSLRFPAFMQSAPCAGPSHASAKKRCLKPVSARRKATGSVTCGLAPHAQNPRKWLEVQRQKIAADQNARELAPRAKGAGVAVTTAVRYPPPPICSLLTANFIPRNAGRLRIEAFSQPILHTFGCNMQNVLYIERVFSLKSLRF